MEKINSDMISLAKQNAVPIAEKSAMAITKSHLCKHNKEMEAAEQFETMMTQQLVHSMQSSLEKGNLFGDGVQGDVYSGLTEWELSRFLAKNAHFGIKEQILRQLPKEDAKP